MPQRCSRLFCRRLLRSAFAFPSFLAIKGFREDMVATSVDINPHLAGACREVSAVHFKLGIGDVKIELDRLNRFDSSATAHGFGVTLDYFVKRRRERLHPNDAVASMAAQTKAIKRRCRFTITRNDAAED